MNIYYCDFCGCAVEDKDIRIISTLKGEHIKDICIDCIKNYKKVLR